MIKAKNPKLISVHYLRRRHEQKECFEVVYLDDNDVPQVTYEEPMATIYIVKPEFRDFTYKQTGRANGTDGCRAGEDFRHSQDDCKGSRSMG